MIRKIFAVTAYHFQNWRRNPKIFLTFGMALVMCFLLTEKAVAFSQDHATYTQIMEPFIWAFGDTQSILLASSLLLLLFSDMPFLSQGTPFYLVRMDRKTWLLGQALYIGCVTVFYIFWILLCTTLLCARTSFVGNQWSRTAALLGYSSAGSSFFLPSSVRTMEGTTPYCCAGTICLLMLLYVLLLVFLMLAVNLKFGNRAGIVSAIGFSVYGYLLQPDTLVSFMNLMPEERYLANLILGWISPLSHATYPMHNFGFDRLPTLEQTYLIFSFLIMLCFVAALAAAKKYNFAFTGTEDVF